MPSISVGQADNLLSAGSVSYPTYTNGSLSKNQYPCKLTPPDVFQRPKPIPLGSYDPVNEFQHFENAVPSGFGMPLYKDEEMLYENPYEAENQHQSSSKEEFINYERHTQHSKAGEMSDLAILFLSASLFIILLICTYLSFRM